jgi:hypothetical protein
MNIMQESVKDSQNGSVSNRVVPEQPKTSISFLEESKKASEASKEPRMQMSARLNIGTRLMLGDNKWKFWKSGVENKVNGSGEFGLD